MDELINELYGAMHFFKIDLRFDYLQIRFRDEDIHKTTFRCHFGHYEYLVTPFGLTSIMNQIFMEHLRSFMLVFFDDILIYNNSYEDHLIHLNSIFIILEHQEFYTNKSKCDFGLIEIFYLRHIINNKGVQVDQKKIATIQYWPTPTNLTQLRGFLGLCSYYRRFIIGFIFDNMFD